MVDDWAAMPEPKQIIPEAATCHDERYSQQPRLGPYYSTVACTEPHQIETVHVGTFEGEAAERGSSPNPRTPEWRTAYEECDEQAADYLGADFRYGWLWLGVAVPADLAWRAGARWFRCDLAGVDQHDNFVPVGDASLRGALTGPSRLSLGCFTVATGDAENQDFTPIEEQDPVDCGEPHQAEFVGVWFNESRYLDNDDDWTEAHTGCFELATDYIGITVGGGQGFRLGTIVDGMSEEEWDNGDRGIRCYLWLDGAELTRSLEGAGIDALPPP